MQTSVTVHVKSNIFKFLTKILALNSLEAGERVLPRDWVGVSGPGEPRVKGTCQGHSHHDRRNHSSDTCGPQETCEKETTKSK